MKKDWLNYQIDNWSIKQWHIQLNTYDQNWIVLNTYPVSYSVIKEIEEIEEKKVEKKKIEDFINQNEDGEDFIDKKIVIVEEIEQIKTWRMIPNPNYRNPQSIKDLINICIENWFEE